MSSVNVCVVAQTELVCMYGHSQGLGTQQRVCALSSRFPCNPMSNIEQRQQRCIMNNYEQEKALISVHIGNEIKRVMKEQGRSVSWLSRQLFCDRTNIYKMYNKSSLDTTLLLRVSIALNYNFFNYFVPYCGGN